MSIFKSSAVRWPMTRPFSLRMKRMMASSNAMPPVRAAREATTPLEESTATSVVEPPMLTTITPLGSAKETPHPLPPPQSRG